MTRKEEFAGFVKAGLSIRGVVYSPRAELVIFQREPESEVFYAHSKWGAALVGKFGNPQTALEQFNATVESVGNPINLVLILARIFGYTEDEVFELV
ncbi:MAG: hypothetical protein ACYCZW_02780 [Minisyncoccota bacterium]